jgi:3-oxosteroid 1-dehydrogenase
MSEPFDVIVVGGGGGGLSAALTARREGAKVVLLEAGPTLGGTYAYSSGLVWLPCNAYAARDGIKDNAGAAREHILRLSGGRASESHIDRYFGAGREVFEFLETQGVPFDWIPGYPDYYAEEPGGMVEGRYMSSPVFFPEENLPAEHLGIAHESPYYKGLPISWQEIQAWGGYASSSDWDHDLLKDRIRRGGFGFGGATTGYLAAAAVRAGVDIRLNVKLEQLLTGADGGVAGVVVHTPSGQQQWPAAAAVVLACGGYDHSAAMQRRLDEHAPAVPFGFSYVDGGAFALAMNAGAAFVNLGGQLLAPAYHLPDRGTLNIAAREIAFPGSIVVNQSGRRFADDSFYWALSRAMGSWDASVCDYPNLPAFLLFDEQWRRSYRLGPLELGDQLPDWIAAAPTAGELAAKLGIEPSVLLKTISDYNDGALAGRDPEYARGKTAYSRNQGDPRVGENPCVRALEPPLYAITMTLGSMGTLSGLRTADDGLVLRNDGSPVRGLYACGNAMANEVEGNWYTSGTSNGRGLIFGRVAVLSALGKLA